MTAIDVLGRIDPVKTFAQLQAECIGLGLSIPARQRARKQDYVRALQQYHWNRERPDQALPAQIMPMLLASWNDVDDQEAAQIEDEGSGWIVQPKLDGVRCLLHVEGGSVRLTSRCVSEVTYRLSELQNNVPHLTKAWSQLDGTILDGELVCPVAEIDTGHTVTGHPLQAAVAIIATSPENAHRIQEQHNAHLQLHVFDVLRFAGKDVTAMPLLGRLDLIHRAVMVAGSPNVTVVPSFAVNKTAVHRRIIETGGEGTVWKRLDQPYTAGRRVKHWVKRKREVVVEGFVSGFKPGNNGHGHLVGALEFSRRLNDGNSFPVAYVSALTDAERRAMTHYDSTRAIRLNPAFLGRRALVVGQNYSAKSKRLRHARMVRWLDE